MDYRCVTVTKTAKQKRDTSTNDYLNVIVDYRATAILAYDSIAMKMYLGDEAGKWERPNNYIDHWTNIKPTMVQGGSIVGKALIGAAIGETVEVETQAGILKYKVLEIQRSN